MKCVIISAGKICDYETIKKYIAPGDYVIAADGGVRHLTALGVQADCILGDFDSLGYIPDCADEVYPSQKDDTDTMLAVKHGLSKGFDDFLMIGGLGMIYAVLCVLSVKLKKSPVILLFVISFVCILGMGYMSAKDFTQAYMNWVAECVNLVGQLTLLIATLVLHRHGLSELKLKTGESL